MPDEQHHEDHIEPVDMPPELLIPDNLVRLGFDFAPSEPSEGKSALTEWIGELMRSGRIEGVWITDPKSYRQYGSIEEFSRPRDKSFFAEQVRLRVLEWPVRVGDVVRIIDITGHARPQPGHVVDVTGGWLTVGSVFGRRTVFYAQTGFMVGDWNWRLEPYLEVPLDG